MMKLIERDAVGEMTNDSRSETYRKEAAGLLPPHIKVGCKSLWIEHEIQTVIAARIAGKSTDEVRCLVVELVAERPGVLDRMRQHARSAKT